MENEPKIEAPSSKEKIANALGRLHWLKNDFKSEIVLSGLSPDIMYKVRNNWWNGLIGDLEEYILPLLGKQANAILIEEIRNFFTKYCNSEFSNRLKTKHDVDDAEELIDKIISALKNLQNGV